MFSLTASGTIGKTIVMSKWKGLPYARSRVIPLNLRTADQQLERGYLGTIAKAAKAVLTAAKDTLPGLGSQFFLDTIVHIPGTKSWIAQFQANEHSSVGTDDTHFKTLAGVIVLYEAAAASLGLVDYITVGNTPVTYTAGFQLYILAKFAVSSLNYTGFATGGIDAATAPELVAFNTYVGTSV
jgi:hypothetical protein